MRESSRSDGRRSKNETKSEREEDARGHSSAEPSLPSATSRFHSCRQPCMLPRSFLSEMTFSTQASSAFSSCGTKKDESKDKTLSKLADSDVMWSATAYESPSQIAAKKKGETHPGKPTQLPPRRR